MKRRGVLFAFLVFIFIILLNVISADCTFRRLDWGPGTIVENTDATINIGVQGDTCQGKVVSLVVKEYDRGQTDDTPISQPASVTIGSNSPQPNTWVFAYGSWVAQFMEDLDHSGETNPPEYYIIATLDGQTATTREDRTYVFSNQYLNVTKYVAPQCAESDGGKTYNTFGTLTTTNSSGAFNFNDTCTNLSNLKEYYCNGGQMAFESYNCTHGCINGACNLSQPQGPQTYNSLNCSDSEIKQKWDSVFKETSTGVSINSTRINGSESCFAYLAYKVKNDDVYYLAAFNIDDFFGINLSAVTGTKFKANQNTINNLMGNPSNASLILTYAILNGDFKTRSSALSLNNANSEFGAFFREPPSNWTSNFSEEYNETAYIFSSFVNTSTQYESTAGVVMAVRDYSAVVFSKIIISDEDEPESQALADQANKSIKNAENQTRNIRNQVKTYPLYYQTGLNKTIDFTNIDNKISELKTRYANASSNQNYLDLIKDAANLPIPLSIEKTDSGNSLIFFPRKENIDVSIVSIITGESYNETRLRDYEDGVISWNLENIETKINFEEISLAYRNSQTSAMRAFGIYIDEKKSLDTSPYLIIRDIANLEFKKDYGQKQASGYWYMQVSPGQEPVEFSTTENVDFLTLNAFLSPEISKLTIKEIYTGERRNKISKWILYIILLAIIIAVGFVLYKVLYNWYRDKYESYLFQNRTHLYNLLMYINISRSKGMKENEIEKNLKNTGWHGEQITYAMKKYAGKRTGMSGLSLGSGPRTEMKPPIAPKGFVPRNRFFMQKNKPF